MYGCQASGEEPEVIQVNQPTHKKETSAWNILKKTTLNIQSEIILCKPAMLDSQTHLWFLPRSHHRRRLNDFVQLPPDHVVGPYHHDQMDEIGWNGRSCHINYSNNGISLDVTHFTCFSTWGGSYIVLMIIDHLSSGIPDHSWDHGIHIPCPASW
jgi:hypothetical protein